MSSHVELIFDPSTLQERATDDVPTSFVVQLSMDGVEHHVANVRASIGLLQVDDVRMPVTVNETDYDNSYVCSPYTTYTSYVRSELSLLENRWLEALLSGAISVACMIHKLAHFNRTVSINNWLISTNVVPSLTASQIAAMTQLLTTRFPTHSLSIRSLNQRTDGALMRTLEHAGYVLVPTRQVYLFPDDDRSWWERGHTQRDQRLIRTTQLTFVTNKDFGEDDHPTIEQLYRQIYIDKYTPFNPRYTARFISLLQRIGLLELFGLRDATRRLVGVTGLVKQSSTLTAPFLGYDTTLPRKLGLYRLLMAMLLREAHQEGTLLNLSAGVGTFKRRRGGVPQMEYTAYYVDHLSHLRQRHLRRLAQGLNTYLPRVLDKYRI